MVSKRKDQGKLSRGGETGASFRKKNVSAPLSTNNSTMKTPLYPSTDMAFKVLLSARVCAAIWSNISDCDETFNYWEPLHYLLYNKGLQTWEYSSEFALRSYTYLMIHGTPAYIYKQIFEPYPMLIFYFIRLLLGLGCAVTEVYFYKGVCREFGVHVGRSWLVFQLFAAGMFISSSALLPSSFSMYLSMAALSAWWHQQNQLAIFFTAISVLLGWPFVGLLSIPIIFDIVLRQRNVRIFIFWSIISGVTVLLPMILIDSSYFGKLVLAPVNLVLYNVLKKEGGPDLYGTEPFVFYIYNGFLNYNFVWLLSLLTPILLVISWLAIPANRPATLSLPYWLSLAPYYLWLGVMMSQPHKEERFLFPVYPLISLCGAISIDCIQKIFFRVKSAIFSINLKTHYLNHSTFIVVFFVVISTMLNISRIFALYTHYHAPLDTFMELSHLDEMRDAKSRDEINVCIGKDWHRFPSSFFLPSTKYSVRFIRSEFDGMLPAYYSDSENATQISHKYFNDMNEGNDFMIFEDIGKCHFLVDLDLKTESKSKLEPNYSNLKDTWTIVKELPFLNSLQSHPLYRAFYFPMISKNYVKYGSFNLLQRQSSLKKD